MEEDISKFKQLYREAIEDVKNNQIQIGIEKLNQILYHPNVSNEGMQPLVF
jgi:chloramphenicol O-acetyltransferase